MKEETYIQNPKICLNCGNIHSFIKRKNKFCSASCAVTFSNIQRGPRTQETKNKIGRANTGKIYLQRRKDKERKIKKSLQKENGKYIYNLICFSCLEKFISNKRSSLRCKSCTLLNYNKVIFKKLNIMETNLKLANKESLNILYKEYFINGLSKFDLQQKYGLRSNTIYNFFKKNGVKLRSNSESVSLALLNGKFNNIEIKTKYKCGWHITWDNKSVYLRSSYEFDYASKLDAKKILYEVESKRIKYFSTELNKFKIAIPDFYLPLTNEIIEIKSMYTFNKCDINDRFKEFKNLGYKPKIIIDKKEYKIGLVA